MTSSAQLEHETEQTRNDLVHTFQELRSRMTVGQLAEEVWHQVRDGYGRDAARGVMHQVTHNPLPSALIGAGIVWMLYGSGDRSEPYRDRANGPSRRHPSSDRTGQSETNSKVTNMVNQATSAASDAASSASSAVSDAVDGIGKAASATYETVTDGAAQAASAVGDAASRVATATTESAQAIATRTGRTAQRMVDFCVDHPLVLAGAGLAIGAAIGSVLPASDAENKLLGRASDEVKRKAEHLASEQLQKAEAVGERLVDDVSDAAAREIDAARDAGKGRGSMPDNVAMP